MLRSSDERLTVLLDAAFLGRLRHPSERSPVRAGVHRVVEQTVRSLAAAPGVDLMLDAGTLVTETVAYVKAHPELVKVPLAIPARARLGARLRTRAVEQHLRTGTSAVGALPWRIANRVAGDANRALDVLGYRAGRSALARADVFHSPFNPLPPVADRGRHVRYFLTVYDLIPLIHPEVVANAGGDGWMRAILASLRPDDYVVAISEHTRQDLLHARPDLAPERVSVTPLAADPEQFYPCDDAARIAAVRARYGIPDGPYLLGVGTLAPHKNIGQLIRAFAAVVASEQIHDLQLVLTGSEQWAERWGSDALATELRRHDDVRHRIVFTGYVDDADLAPLYSGALAFAYPSLYEGFGLPPLEAMQCGTPVIASNTSSLPEVVGDAGVLVDPRDLDALAGAILAVYRDPAYRAALAARALARSREFSWARYADQTVAAYRVALGLSPES